MTSALFSPCLFSPGKPNGLELENRIVVAPMCMYSAVDGEAQDWHLMHWANLLNSGAGMVTIEATGVTPEGRISNGCLGLWDDKTGQAFGDKLRRARYLAPPTPVCVQLAHAGRKGSSARPWEGGALLDEDGGGWETLAPSAIPHKPEERSPTALDGAGLERILQAFVSAAKRAAQVGADAVEVHAAHGYLLHQFLSPLANQREDNYGGTFENRIRFPLEVVQAVREVFKGAVGVRVSATDWVEGGWTPEETADFSVRLKEAGCEYVHVSAGGVSPLQRFETSPGFLAPFSRMVKQKSGLTTTVVGLITEPELAQKIITDGDADLVALGRGFLYNPRWGWSAAAALGAQVQSSHQYWRGPTGEARHIFGDAVSGGR